MSYDESYWFLKLPGTTDGDVATPAIFLCSKDVPGYTGYRDSGKIPTHRTNKALGEGRVMSTTETDFSLLRSRLYNCEMANDGRVSQQPEEDFRNLRFIDVTSCCVVDAK
jgi:hypothetical protein